MRKDDNSDVSAIAVLIILAIAFGVALAHAKLVYGDYSCVFARCIKVKP